MALKNLHDWIESHQGRFAGYRLRVGSGANPPTLAIVATAEAADRLGRRFKTSTIEVADDVDDLSGVIEELASEHGYPTENPTLRLHALGLKPSEDGASFTQPRKRTETRSVDGSSAGAIEALTGALVAMNRSAVKTIDILTETLAHREETLEQAIESLVEARADQAEAEADNLATQVISQASEPDNNPLQEAAARTLETIAARFNGSSAPPRVDVDTVIGLLEADPDLARSLAQDPRVVDLVMRSVVVEAPQDAPQAPKKRKARSKAPQK